MTKEINLKNGRKALVDDDDFEYLSRFKWYWVHGYAYRNIGKGNERTTILMHDEIMRPPKGLVIDHINGIGIDNQKSNLRICSRSQNNANSIINKNNTSGFKGVSFDKLTGKWRAYISVNNKYKLIGYRDTAEEAARLYDEEAIKIHGEFAKTNKRIYESN